MKLVTIQLQSKIAAIHKIPSPTGKFDLMSFIVALNFYTKFIEKLHLTLNRFTINGQMNMNVSFKNKKCLSILKQNLQYQIRNTHFSSQLMLHLLD